MRRLFGVRAATDASGNGDGFLNPRAEEAALLDCLSDGVLTTDASDRITYANRVARELLGGALLGDEILSLFARDSREAVRFGQRAARDGLPQRYDADL